MYADDVEDPLVDDGDLDGQAGAPFDQDVLESACSEIRGAAGWHIAPTVEQTMRLDGRGGSLLHLPTLHLVEVLEVTQLGVPIALTSIDFSRAGMLQLLHGCWSTRLGSIEVRIKHGFPTCPPALFRTVAETARWVGVKGELRSRSLGDRSESWRDSLTAGASSTLDRYALRPTP